ncbi:MAG: TlpA disulfide reductase family protein [Candidatus Pseudobacter hemicellulosilyticus]|uniref:TlpA disulfide reductase family protein n=1 Tax=Candidatus Pseudobacter hemicellulosilyticus TaxID=3121375 RepID=A0AAJ5WTV4_9BACT|nr:MAG: TlpA disulfide reductase family protein [Pseudobacter sp.]
MKSINILFLLLMAACCSMAQTGRLQALSIGQPVPELPFRGMINYSKANPSIRDFKGKLVILDFWASTCATCIASFPKMEALQREFPDELQVILVNATESNAVIRKKFERSRLYKPGIGLSGLPSVNGDSNWRTLFPYHTVPHHVWIGADGKVLAITNYYNATPEHVRAVLSGKQVSMALKKDLSLEGHSFFSDGLIVPSHPSQHLTMSSAFGAYLPGGGGGEAITRDTANGLLRKGFYGTTPLFLLKRIYAEEGGPAARVLVLSNRQDKLIPPADKNLRDNWLLANGCSYEIQLPLAQEPDLDKLMKEDLNRFLGIKYGVEAGREERTLPALVLVKTDGGPRPSTGEPAVYHSDTSAEWENSKWPMITDYLSRKLEDPGKPLLFLDETGLDDGHFRTTMQLPASSLKDPELLREHLRRYNLDLERTERTVSVVVVRDKMDPGK